MIVDNFELIKSLLTFKSEGEFYLLQVMQRRKENPDLPTGSRIIKDYYISSIDSLLKHEDEIRKLSKVFNARVYINLTTRNYENIALQTMKRIADNVIGKTYKNVPWSYSAVANTYSFGEKFWVIDIDTKDESFVSDTIIAVEGCQSGFPINTVTTLPTINGFHIITHPFNVKELEPYMATHDIEVKKNSLTLLYYGD